MNLIALLIGLLIERLATQLFHLRELRWLDHVIDAGFRQVKRSSTLPTLIPVILLALLLVLPVFLVIFLAGDRLFGFPYVLLAIIVLFFSLGPKDIGEDIDDYCKALEDGSDEDVMRAARALTEKDVPEASVERIRMVEEAVCVQANNRLFAVIFWFVVLGPLGPLGAWLYRVTDLIRRRAVFDAARVDGEAGAARVVEAARMLHGWLAWLPARLTAIGYALAGSFDGAISAWRTAVEQRRAHHGEQSEFLLASVGAGALALAAHEGESERDRAVRGALAAKGMVYRLFLIWAAVIAAMTLYGWPL